MPTEETLLTVLLIALAANFGLMVLVIIAAWIRGRRRRIDDSAPITITPASLDAARDAARAAAASMSRPAVSAMASTRATDAVAPSPPVPAATDDDSRSSRPVDAGPLLDPSTGLDSPRAWSRTLSDEMARVARYRRPASIVLVEVEGLERLVDRFGADAAERLLPVISDTLRKNARAADHVAALERGRYGVLLTETDEVRAINFIERVRTACDGWLAAGAVTLRLAIGWADANAGRTIDDAVATAADRLDADRRRPAPDSDLGAGSIEAGSSGV